MKIRNIIYIAIVLIIGGLGFIFIPKIMAVTVTMDATADITFTGLATGDAFGRAVASADVNGDGYADAIAAAHMANGVGTDRGQVYIYFGGAGGMDNTADLTLTGPEDGDKFGDAVASVDVDNDGCADVIVGAPWADGGGSDRGQAFVYLGGASMDNAADVTFTGAADSDFLGYSVASAGNVDGDVYDDVIVGAYLADGGGTDRGQAYVYLGGESAGEMVALDVPMKLATAPQEIQFGGTNIAP